MHVPAGPGAPFSLTVWWSHYSVAQSLREPRLAHRWCDGRRIRPGPRIKEFADQRRSGRLVKKDLAILQEMHLSGIDAEEYLTWKTKIEAVARKYDEARVIEGGAKKAKKDRKYAAEEHNGRRRSVAERCF
jgi:hypothetical protein